MTVLCQTSSSFVPQDTPLQRLVALLLRFHTQLFWQEGFMDIVNRRPARIAEGSMRIPHPTKAGNFTA
jgi:hypothetical protein